MSDQKSNVSELMSVLKQQRDQLKLSMHLGSLELKEEWSKLDDKFEKMNQDYEPLKSAMDETADDVWESLKLVGQEVKEGFDRIRKSL